MAMQRVSPGIYRNTATGKTVRSATRPVQQPQRQARQPMAPMSRPQAAPTAQTNFPIQATGGSLVQPDPAMQQSGFGGPQPMGPQSPASSAIDQMKGGIPQGYNGAVSQVDDPNAGMTLQDRSTMWQQQQAQGGRCPYCGK